MVQFLTYIPSSKRRDTHARDDTKTGLFLLPIENITHHRIKQKEYSLVKSVNKALRNEGMKEGNVQIHCIQTTDHGGCTVVFSCEMDDFFENLSKETTGCTCFAEPSEKEKAYMQIGNDLEQMMAVYLGHDVTVLVDAQPSNMEIVLGHGILTFYRDFWNALDTIVVFLIWIWFVVHMSVYPRLNAEDYINPLVLSSMRFMRLRILVESTVLFFLSWVAVLKMSQWLISLNDAINSFYIMIRDNLTIIGSYWVIGFQFIATFGIIGYLIFASKLYEF